MEQSTLKIVSQALNLRLDLEDKKMKKEANKKKQKPENKKKN